MFGPNTRIALAQSGGKAIGSNLKFQTTRTSADDTAPATRPRALHRSDPPPQRDASSCPSGARKRAPKSMPASSASRALEEDDFLLLVILSCYVSFCSSISAIALLPTGLLGRCVRE